jgi:hypothetical protein
MTDLSKIPTADLVKDLGDSVYDIYVAMRAMGEHGGSVVLKDGKPVALRAGHNLHFVLVICTELLRRQYKPEPT